MVAEERTSCPDLTIPKAMVFEEVGKGERVALRIESLADSSFVGALTGINESRSKSTYIKGLNISSPFGCFNLLDQPWD
jgi:hypothetical protein